MQVDQAAAGLLALGLKKGDRLGMWGPNTYEWILIQFATAKAGIIMVGLFTAFPVMHFFNVCVLLSMESKLFLLLMFLL